MQAQLSSGDANANVKVRGLPGSAGGALLLVAGRWFSNAVERRYIVCSGRHLVANRHHFGSVRSLRGGTVGFDANNLLDVWHLVKANRSRGGLNRVRIFGTFPGRDARDRASKDGFTACPENFRSVQAGLNAYLSANDLLDRKG